MAELADGGGYSYRLCRGPNVTEECFQKTPLQFVNGSQTLRWDGKNGTTKNIRGQYVGELSLSLSCIYCDPMLAWRNVDATPLLSDRHNAEGKFLG